MARRRLHFAARIARVCWVLFGMSQTSLHNCLHTGIMQPVTIYDVRCCYLLLCVTQPPLLTINTRYVLCCQSSTAVILSICEEHF